MQLQGESAGYGAGVIWLGPVIRPPGTSQPRTNRSSRASLGSRNGGTNSSVLPARAASFDAILTWPQHDNGLELHLMSPSGHHYAWYADPTGYTGSSTGPQQFRIPNPESGTWRISVQAVRGGSSPIDFAVTTSGTTGTGGLRPVGPSNLSPFAAASPEQTVPNIGPEFLKRIRRHTRAGNLARSV